MIITHRAISCCAVGEIQNLSEPLQSPAKVIKAFIHDLFSNGGYDYYQKCYLPSTIQKPAGFYIFTEVVATYPQDGYPTADRLPTMYGKRLADYIKRNDLGSVSVSSIARNHRNNPGHAVRVYVWAPKIVGLRRYVEKNKAAFPNVTLRDGVEENEE